MSLTLEQKEDIILQNESDPQRILNILVEIQYASDEGYIDEETAKLVADKLNLSENHVYEVLSFYAILKTKPQARYVIKICKSVPCKYTGAEKIDEMLEAVLGVSSDVPTEDGLFMYHGIPCIGACGRGPAIKIKDRVFTDLTKGDLTQLVNDLKNGQYKDL